MSQSQILIIDDEISMRQLLKYIFRSESYEITTVGSGNDALGLIEKQKFDLIIQDMMLPDMEGIDLLHQIRSLQKQAMVIVITAVIGWKTAVEAMRIGAFDYIRKPFNNDNIKAVVSRALKYKAVLDSMSGRQIEGIHIIGNSSQIQQVQEIIRRAAPTDSTIIIHGESGTGKELVARAIHLASLRRENVFIPVNCAAISETLLESELFGHMKGSFTNAIADKKGLFEISNNGTLFFDEIGEMSLQTQVKLLRVLEYREFVPVGGTEPRQVDVRFITATNRNLEKEIEKGDFREDLYYRLNVIPITLPPLRERKEDIPLLAGHFLALYASRLHKYVTQISDEVMQLLLNYHWPGNIRELSNLIQRAIVLCEGNIIVKEDLGNYIQIENKKREDFTFFPTEGVNLEEKLEELEKKYIKEALKICNGSLTNAARLLQLSFRSLRYKVKKYKLAYD